MPRSTEEWRGKTDDTDVPERVRLRVLLAFDRRCGNCGNTIRPGKPWTCDHKVALINGGENRESNLQPLCDICNPKKNAADVAEKAEVAATMKHHYGLDKPKGAPMPGSRRSKWKRKMDGTLVRR